MAYTDNTSCVTVWRATLNHCPQPYACRQRSRCTPLGLSRKKRYSPQVASVTERSGRMRWVVPPQTNPLSSRSPHHGHLSCIMAVRLRRASVRDPCGSGFVDQAPGDEALELEGLGELVIAPGRQHVRERPPSGGDRLESPGSPAAVDVQPRDRSRPDDGAGVVHHIVIGRGHVRTPVTVKSRMPSSACNK